MDDLRRRFRLGFRCWRRWRGDYDFFCGFSWLFDNLFRYRRLGLSGRTRLHRHRRSGWRRG
jgi:hypothetical protein